MPTPTKRIQVLLRPKILKMVETLSEEDQRTLSKTVALLVEEALIHRGMLDQPQSKTTPSGGGGESREATAVYFRKRKPEDVPVVVVNDKLDKSQFTAPPGGKVYNASEYFDELTDQLTDQLPDREPNALTALFSEEDKSLIAKLKKLKALEEMGLI